MNSGRAFFIYVFHVFTAGLALAAPAASALPVCSAARPRARAVRAWAGEDQRKKGFFRASAIPSGVEPWEFYAGLALLLASNFGVVALVAAGRVSPGSMPPINVFTDIANAAMESKVASGEVQPVMATFWAQSFWAELLGQYLQAGERPEVFVGHWCEADPARTGWCLQAKADALSRLRGGMVRGADSGGGAVRPGRCAHAPRMLAGRTPRRVLAELPFAEARSMARAMGMSSREEWDDYDCPGAYRLPKDPDVAWSAEWQGWEDWLGVTLPFAAAREVVRGLGLESEQQYAELRKAGADLERVSAEAWNSGHALKVRQAAAAVDTGRLPARPDLVYREEWRGWEDWLGK